MDKDKALKLALEACELLVKLMRDEHLIMKIPIGLYPAERKSVEAITAIKQTLAAPVQEADVFDDDIEVTGPTTIRTRYRLEAGTKLYTTPPAAQSAPVPLTDDEVDRAIDRIDQNAINWTQELFKFARAIEAKLKEKNT
jgi:hypothetical protein